METASKEQKTGTWLRMLVYFLGAATFILVIFMTQMVVSIEKEVSHLRDQLATKDDLVNLAVSVGPVDPAMDVLQGTCTDCHTVETFAAAHGMEGDVHDLVTRMSELSGAHINNTEMPTIEAALTYLKCAHCHSIEKLKELAILSPAERWDLIVRMMQEEGATISREDAQRIRDFYGDFWGWHLP
jgi:hypothetical protein